MEPQLRDLVYKPGIGIAGTFDLYRSDESADGSLIVHLHGGGWKSGDKASAGFWADALLPCPLAIAAANYRLSGDAPYPAALEDLRDLLIQLSEHGSEWGIDPARVALVGESAGAHLAALIALRARADHWPGARPRCAVCICGVYDFLRLDPNSFVMDEFVVPFLGPPSPNNPNYREASPVTWLRPHTPPLLLVHGRRDDVAPVEQAQAMATTARTTGAPCTLIEMDAVHTALDPISPSRLLAQEEIERFLVTHLSHADQG